MIIDFHTHCFPDKIAEKALPVLKQRSGITHPFHDGTVSGLLELAKNSGIDYSVVLNIATNPHQQSKVNDFAISLNETDGIIPFGSVHPDSDNALNELERLKANGIKGVKLHPDYQGFFVNDKKMLPIYEKIASLGMITLFHCGFDIGYPEPVHCTAQALAEVLPVFDGSPVVAAHFGGIWSLPETRKHLAGKNVYLDTAYGYGTITPRYAKEIIDIHGVDKILFASDAPWNAPWQDIELVRCFGLSEDEEKAVLGENARKLLGL